MSDITANTTKTIRQSQGLAYIALKCKSVTSALHSLLFCRLCGSRLTNMRTYVLRCPSYKITVRPEKYWNVCSALPTDDSDMTVNWHTSLRNWMENTVNWHTSLRNWMESANEHFTLHLNSLLFLPSERFSSLLTNHAHPDWCSTKKISE